MNTKMHKKRKGDIAELSVASHLIKKGWNVLFPYGENIRYDLVAERNRKFLRIQVKYTTPKDGVLNINCRSSNNWSILHYSKQEIDMIAAFNPLTSLIYFIPIDKINHSLIKLRLSKTKNNQKCKIHNAAEFLKI